MHPIRRKLATTRCSRRTRYIYRIEICVPLVPDVSKGITQLPYGNNIRLTCQFTCGFTGTAEAYRQNVSQRHTQACISSPNVTFRHRPSKTNHNHQEENLQVAVAWSLTFVHWNHPQTWQGSVHPPTCPCNLGFLRRLAAQPANGHSVRPWANAPDFSLASTPFCIQNSALKCHNGLRSPVGTCQPVLFCASPLGQKCALCCHRARSLQMTLNLGWRRKHKEARLRRRRSP